jgi:hypothetical protein
MFGVQDRGLCSANDIGCNMYGEISALLEDRIAGGDGMKDA